MAEETPVTVKPEANATVAETPVIAPSALGPDTSSEKPLETPVESKQTVETANPEEKSSEIAKADERPAEGSKVEVKAEEAKKDEKPAEAKTEEKSVETKAEQKPIEPPKFEALVLPEGVKLEDKQLGEIDSMFGNFEIVSKAPHEEVQKLRQGMVEYGIGFVKDALAQSQKQTQDYWDAKTKEFREAYEKDPEIGGNRKDTTTEAARQFISQHAGSPEHAAEVRKLLYDHKLADHPTIIRLLANANLARSEGKPLPAQKAVPAKLGKLDRFYGSMKE